MEQLPRLQARIASLGELRDLMRALRAMAAARVQAAQAALPGIRRYVETVGGAIAGAADLLPRDDDPTPAPGAGSRGILLIVLSEHGFVGGLNERLLEHARSKLRPDRRLAIVGQRGTALARERGMEPAWSFAMATHAGGVPELTRRIADNLAPATSVDVVFADYRRGGNYQVSERAVLPLDPALLARSGRRGPPLHHIAPQALLERLAGEYLFAEITRAVMESLASENAARLRVMESADRNIGDQLDALRRRERALRQEAITAELLDVVTGSEAILGRAGA